MGNGENTLGDGSEFAWKGGRALGVIELGSYDRGVKSKNGYVVGEGYGT